MYKQCSIYKSTNPASFIIWISIILHHLTIYNSVVWTRMMTWKAWMVKYRGWNEDLPKYLLKPTVLFYLEYIETNACYSQMPSWGPVDQADDLVYARHALYHWSTHHSCYLYCKDETQVTEELTDWAKVI